MDRKDWLLMVLAEAGQRGLSPVQLQKTVFLIGENLGRAQESSFFQFSPYAYGPFCATVYRDAEQLEGSGLGAINYSAGGRWRTYAATDEGRKKAKELLDELKPEDQDYLKQVVQWAQSCSFRQLVEAIYQHYPKMRARSIYVSS